ncbi:MAG: SRPBCC domain-containing protein [Actinomycetota bacterium]|nr:SRPBCC domain-containing protein [Actinomycetota bacterium]
MNRETRIERSERGLRLSRLLPATPDSVFGALSNADELMSWWGPPEYPMVECSIDFRPGGVWHYRLRGVRTGCDVWARSVYREIERPRLVSYFETSSDADGRITDDRPAADVTITLDPDGRQTRMTVDIRYSSLLDRDRAIRMGVERGLSAALESLADLLRTGASHPRRREHDHVHRDVG